MYLFFFSFFFSFVVGVYVGLRGLEWSLEAGVGKSRGKGRREGREGGESSVVTPLRAVRIRGPCFGGIITRKVRGTDKRYILDTGGRQLCSEKGLIVLKEGKWKGKERRGEGCWGGDHGAENATQRTAYFRHSLLFLCVWVIYLFANVCSLPSLRARVHCSEEKLSHPATAVAGLK